MIYELALVARAEIGDDVAGQLKDLVSEVASQYKSEVLLSDDWGVKSFAQPSSHGVSKGRYLYFIYKSDSADLNSELERRFKINESVLKSGLFKLGLDEDAEKIVKAFKSPFSKKYAGSVLDENEDTGVEKNKRKLVRRKVCWFTVNNIMADWKDPNTFSWLVNEFGKISPARVTGVSRKHQRFVTTAIKRARQMGVASYLTGRIMK